jgi:hypothetical protein
MTVSLHIVTMANGQSQLQAMQEGAQKTKMGKDFYTHA